MSEANDELTRLRAEHGELLAALKGMVTAVQMGPYEDRSKYGKAALSAISKAEGK